MDFHLALPDGDVYLFSYDGHTVQIPSIKAPVEQQVATESSAETLARIPA